MRILLVDDEQISLTLVAHHVSSVGYDVLTAQNGEDALEILHEHTCPIVITDWDMPRMDGLELCRRIRAMTDRDYVYIIMLTSHSDGHSVVTGLSAGADEFITKPCRPEELQVRLRTAERILALQSRNLTIFTLAKLAESRDPETGAHLERIREYARTLTRDLLNRSIYGQIVNAEFVDLIYQTSPLHDIGKVGVPDGVLQKPGRLTNAEFEVMKQHTVIGWGTLSAAAAQFPNARFLTMAAEIARSHHERYDGTGYPDGLRGAEIPVAARVVALADVYDALTTKRVYKEAFTHESARSIILDGRSSHFDPNVVDSFMRCESEFSSIRAALNDGVAGDVALLGAPRGPLAETRG